MAPSARRVVCTCTQCSQYFYVDGLGVKRAGLEIDLSTRKSHLLADQQTAYLALATNEDTAVGSNDFVEFDWPGRHQKDKTTPLHDNHSHILDSLAGLSLDVLEPESQSKSIVYDCTPFHTFSSGSTTSPAVTIVNLKTALLYLTEMCSLDTSTRLLQLDRKLIELVASQGLNPAAPPGKLAYADQVALNALPHDTRTVLRRLAIDPQLTYFVCCSACFAMYPDPSTAPERCSHHQLPDRHEEDSLDDDTHATCHTELFTQVGTKRSPIRRFAFQNLYDWLARMFCRKEIEDALEKTAASSRSRYDPSAEKFDIHDSRIWKEFQDNEGRQFTANSGNVTFGMFTDGINPYGNRVAGKHASVTFLIMVCLSLPVRLRYQPENIFLVGIAPGPKEPSLDQINWIIRPVVDQLKKLWDCGMYLSKTPCYPNGRLVSAALLPFFADLPALRRSLGFAAATATRMCSYCLLKKSEITNIDVASWPKRQLDDHRKWANLSRDATNLKEQKTILNNHGVRYSVLLELPYWNILEYHVVDAMHNLLLGLLKWHCQRFWLMSDVDDEKEPKTVSTKELDLLIADAAANLPARPSSPSHANPEEGIPFLDLLLGTNTDPSDTNFVPDITHDGWGGKWVPSPTGKVIFDSHVLKYVNSRLNEICIPTWIKRAIPQLGKASFGRLKADEWRNLFTIQLPLIMPLYWDDGDAVSASLLHNFAHLVSLVNLALKRSMNMERIDKYRHHIQEYIKSSLVIFPETNLAPNHHMAFHLADCLERFGPCRAWWSFSMERMMAQVLKSSGNNRLGQLEITYLTTFCRVANLKAILSNRDFPLSLEPCIRSIKALYNPEPFKPQTSRKMLTHHLNAEIFKQLVEKLNDLHPLPTGQWLESDKWYKLKSTDTAKFIPVTSRAQDLKNAKVADIIFSTTKANKNNSFVLLKENSKARYGAINKIFLHSRTAPGILTSTDTWLVIHPLLPVPESLNPYGPLGKYDLDVTLRKLDDSICYLIHVDEILAHCAWIKFNSGEVNTKLDYETYGLLGLDR